MLRSVVLRSGLLVLLALTLSKPVTAQIVVPFTSGPIPPCDTGTFTANVSGIGMLSDPWNPWWSYTLQGLTINITSDHPQTLQIFLTSPQGTELLLSAFNGAGGQNYTNTTFGYSGYPSITTGTAPFTGTWTGQGGGLSVFDGQNADGIWTITVIDTACANGGVGPGGTWTPGWFDGSGAGSGGFAFAFSGPPPCWGGIPSGSAYVCPGQTFDLTDFYQVMWSGYDYTFGMDWAGNPVPDPTAVDAGSYHVEAYDPWQGCMYWATFDVYPAAQIALGPDQVVDQCGSGGPVNLSALFTLTGVTTAYWSLNGSPISVTTANAATAPGLYQLIGTNWGDCNDTALVTLNIIADPVLGADQSVSMCPGASADLTQLYDITGLSGTWYFGGIAFPTPTAAMNAGVYSLVVTAPTGCTATADVTLDVQASPSLGADQSVDVCSSASLDLTTLYGTAGLATSWTLTGAPVADPTSVSAAGAYQLVASNGPGCTDTAIVSVNAVASPALGPDAVATVCAGNVFDLTTTFVTTGLTTAWTSSGAPVPDPTSVSTTGFYSLTATSASGCSDMAQMHLTVSANPALGADQVLSICPGTSADLTALYNTTGLASTWYFGGVTFPTPTAASDAGMYTLMVTTAGGCTDEADVTLTLLAPPVLGADQSIDVCTNASFDLTSLYGTAGLATSWTLLGLPVADPASVSSAGTYQLVALNGSGCVDTALVSVNAITTPTLGPDANAAVCAGNAFDLTATFPGTGLNTTWTLAGAAVPDPTAVGTAGLYTLIATSASGCSDTAQVHLTVAANPVLGPDQSVTECDGAVVDLTVLYTTGTTTTAWTESGVAVADPIAVTSSGIYTLIATNGAGCAATVDVTVVLDPAPALGADQSSSICEGSTFDLTSAYVTSGLAAEWTLGGAPVADPVAVDVTGTYQLVATNGSGCSDTAVVSLTVNANPSLGADQMFSLCPWQTVDLSTTFPVAGMIATYTLNGQPVVDPTAISDTGTYVITVTDTNGCADEAMASVVALECLCVADFIHDARCIQDPAQFKLLADSTILGAHWDFGGAASASTDVDPQVWFTARKELVVTLQATLSCGVVTVQRKIDIQDCTDSCSVWIPSAFTPDNDSRNDTWTWNGECEPEDFSMQIFNRSGELIFTSTDPLIPWDGTYHGTVSPDGVYVYRVGYRLPYQKRREVMGSLTLVR